MHRETEVGMAGRRSLIIENRGRLRHVAGLLGIILMAICFFVAAAEWNDLVLSLSYSAAGVISAHILMRLYLLYEELPLFHRTCGGTLQNLFTRLMPNSIASVLTLIVAVLGIFYKVELDPVQSKNAILFYLGTCTCTFISLILRAEECTIWQDHTMSHLNGLDYGSGMAQSFFYGYLKLVLPAKGDQSKNFIEKIIEFMERSRLEEHFFPVKKLIILIPSSGHSYPTLRDVPSQTKDAEPAISPLDPKDVEPHRQDRAGTKGREYRMGSYRIKVEHEKKTRFLYALVEGATPLLTFKEACETSEYLRKHRVDVVSNFYRTLDRMIKNDRDCAHLVELIPYDDEGEEPDVVKIVQNYLLDRCDKSKVFA